MKKIFVFIFIIFILSCKGDIVNSKQKYQGVTFSRATRYLIHIYNKTKWSLYCIYCDKNVLFYQTQKDDSIKFGTLPLIFNNMEVRRDSIEYNFCFYYQNKKLDASLISNFSLQGFVYKYPSDTIVYSSSTTSFRYYKVICSLKDCPDRSVNPLQPEVILFIRENANKLDSWFLNEAKSRGIFDSTKYPPHYSWKFSTRTHQNFK